MPTDATVAPSTTDTPIEDLFYSETKPDAKAAPSPAVPNSETPAPAAGAVQTEAATEPAETDDEPLDLKAKSPRNSWADMRTARYRAEAERDHYKELAERKAAPLPAAAPAEVAEPTGKPSSDDPAFATHDDYLDARDKWNRAEWKREADEAVRLAEEAKTTKAAEEKSAKLKETWEARETVVKGTHPTYDANFAAFLKAAQTNQTLATAVFESEIGPDLAQHLGATEAELARIAALEPRFLLRAIGVLEHTLKASDKGSEIPLTRAPRPLAPVSGTAGTAAKDLTLEQQLYG